MQTNLKVKKGKGVLCKDNRTPYAAKTLHVVKDGRMVPLSYNMQNLLAALLDPKVEKVILIDEENSEFTIQDGDQR